VGHGLVVFPVLLKRRFHLFSIQQRVLPLTFLLLLVLSACGSQTTNGQSNTNASPTAAPVSLTVFAASSLTTAFNDIKTAYHTAHPNVTITYNYNGSQALEQQIANGAPDDIFASADLTNMQKASSANLVGPSQIFAKNKLTVIVPASNPARLHVLKDLANPGVKIDVGGPSVPVGKYTLQVLDNLGHASDYGTDYENSVKANFVSQEENDAAIVQKVQLGTVDAGIVYVTDVTPANATKVTQIAIPDQFNVIAQYPIAVTKSSTHASAAQAFVQYILSSQGQAILNKYYFLPPNA
jgi:molybdate transport system substrate-binding protein